ncbi:GGDEF domain-containing protein, partial [Desulfovibrio sp. OttesenSCG-928-C14]|nr:GGDEF domain-containing protein [Desulfovibrio sp. OttesenSCG-928-C14]
MKTKPENILPEKITSGQIDLGGQSDQGEARLSPLAAGRVLLEEKRSPLNSLDLMQYEAMLRDSLFKVLPFAAHSLYFPMQDGGNCPPPEYLPEEEKLLLPLCEEGRQLGLFVARGLVPPPELEGQGKRGRKKLEKRLERLLPLLPGYARLCLDNIALCKNSRLDQVSGLHNRVYLLDQLAESILHMRESLRAGAGFGLGGEPAPEAEPGKPAPGQSPASSAWAAPRFGLMVIRLNGLAGQVREHGYLRAEALVEALARKLEDLLAGRDEDLYSGPLGDMYASLQLSLGRVLAARSGDYEFTLLLPGLGSGPCRELGRFLAWGLSRVSLKNELTGRGIFVRPSIGFAVAPKDLDGLERRHPAEQARILLRRARLASAMVYENLRQYSHLYGKQLLSGVEEELSPVLGYGSILSEGGRVVQVFPLSRMLVSLGRNSGARVGQSFTLWGYGLEEEPGRPPRLARRYKGEVRLVEVEQNVSTAE